MKAADNAKPLLLPTDAKARKDVPVATGVLDYFPDAIAAVAAVSKTGNEQHNPGKPLHWDRSKSTDEADALARHFLERGKLDVDGHRHSAKVAWRALALLQKEIEADPSEVAEYPAPQEAPTLLYCNKCNVFSDDDRFYPECILDDSTNDFESKWLIRSDTGFEHVSSGLYTAADVRKNFIGTVLRRA